MTTESVDPRFLDIDAWPVADAVAAMAAGQARAVAALTPALPAIAAAAEAGAARLRRGGRLAYAGAGTSGRLAVQDGVELTPTFDWPEERLVFLLAGGATAMMRGIEGAEDDGDAARAAVAQAMLGADDVLVAVAASGRTPYTRAATTAARAAGALTIAIANNVAAPLLIDAAHALLLDTGAEVVAGSTRMQAGTAQKAALNILSTAMMLRLGLVHRGRMVAMRATNAKLRSRAEAMVADLAGVGRAAAAAALSATGYAIRPAILVARGATPDEAAARLAAAGGDLRRA
ncbi:N-acetylmuramic acid 6-phosphate etherase [Sphingomonas sp. Leaf412]|uniref:N-acetylmuramic acid 6-phosphate etherase n=1 Tax=Sphingomonas sp. Leaf412 TaxID=1736370 RepID=UPI0006F3E3CD|nr:N-acetylmuramic acid 6-phosphate etherase [Sphingomonas sp. Leaf412]KQT34605.1 N-acetylmuramic acid 6-phosphate etherase [Sphingomonas sp. Leaf412]